MKKIYFSSALILGIVQVNNAQLTLTKAFNEPVTGDVVIRHSYDSTTAVPKATGAGLNWNFTSLVAGTNTESSTYVTTASTPSAAIFPGATMSEHQGGDDYQHYKSTATSLEVQGIQFSQAVINFSNTAILFTWPVNFGYNITDAFGGSTTTGSITTSIVGSITSSGSGSGTVVIPGGSTFTNCLQVLNSITFTLASGSFTQAHVQKEYNYYHSSNKFPILTINYQTQTSGTMTSMDFDAKVNKAVVVGLISQELNSAFSLFPNPASETINISLSNNSNDNVYVSLTNALGQIVKSEYLGKENLIRSDLNLSGLPKGIYLVNLKIGQISSVKKIVLE